MKTTIALCMCLFVSPVFAKRLAPVSPEGSGWHNGKPNYNFIGFRSDIGVPDGLGFSLAYRFVKFWQMEIGGTTTLVGAGVRVGTTMFLPYYISPLINVEYGHQWVGDANKLVTLFGAPDPKVSLLSNIEYDYVNLHGGLQFGNPNWAMIFIHIGYSYVWGNTNGLQKFIQERASRETVTANEATAKIWAPSIKAGIQLYF